MDDKLDIEAKEIIAIVTSVQPIIDAYHRGELTEEEIMFLQSVMQSLWPTLQSVISGIWKDLEPIMTHLGLWPLEEEPLYQIADGNLRCDVCGMTYFRHPIEVLFSDIGEIWLRKLCSGELVKL